MGRQADDDPTPGDAPAPGGSLPGAGLPGQSRPELLAAFEDGGAWDAAAPSAALAAALEAAAGPRGLYDGAGAGAMVGITRQWTALESWAAGGTMGALRSMTREDAEGRPLTRRRSDLPDGWSDSLNYEIAAALAMGPVSAGNLAALAWTLGQRLPGIGRLLTAGVLTKSKARLIVATFEPLTEDEATRAEALLLGELKGKTWFQVQRLAWRAAVTVAPDVAERRRAQAEKKRARVMLFREESGAVGLSGRDLPAAGALAGHANVVARAAQYEASGAFPGRSTGSLQALAYVHLLSDLTLEQAISFALATTEPPDDASHHNDDEHYEDEDEDDHEDDEDPFTGADSDLPGNGHGHSHSHSGDEGPNGGHDDYYDPDDHDDLGDDDDPGDYDDPDDDGDPGDPGGGAPRGGPRHSDDDAGPAGDDDGSGDSGDAGGGDPHGGGDSGGAGDSGDPGGNGDPGDGDPGPGGPGGRAALPEVTAPLATLQGRVKRPGDNRLLGALDPALTRDLATAAARSPNARWEITIVDERGYAIGHGTLRPRRGKHHHPPPPGPAYYSLPARVNITVTQTLLHQLATQPRSGAPPGDWELASQAAGDADGPWVLTLPGGRELTVRFDVVPTHGCDHRHQVNAYQPSDKLRRLVQVRDHECTFPPCSTPAHDSDFEHAIPYHKGGKTDACNAGARSRRCHQVKQTAGWTVTQPKPGWHVWTTPTGRTYTQEPWRYIA